MTMDAQNNLGYLRDQIQDFLYAAIVRAIHQAAEMEAAMKLHQEWMKDVCDSIRAHYLWESFARFSPSLSSQYCWIVRKPFPQSLTCAGIAAFAI